MGPADHTPDSTVRAYYDALRGGDPLAPFFADAVDLVKFGIGERLVGSDEVATGLQAQTERTRDWTVRSQALRVVDRGEYAAFSDDVRMAWHDVETGVDHEYETRWSGTLERVGGRNRAEESPPWQFIGMHVSVPGPTAEQ